MTIGGRFLLTLLILTALLWVMIGRKQYTLRMGTPVRLELRKPVDPRSLFRGDYVRLHFAVGQLRLYDTLGDMDYVRFQEVWVLLQEGKPYWRPISYHRTRPELGEGQVALRGKVNGFQNWDNDLRRRGVNLIYGIEDFFVPEGSGLAWEESLSDETVVIEVAVDNGGNSAVRAILIKGKEVYREGLF